MNPIYQEFVRDLQKLRRLLDLSELLVSLPSFSPPEVAGTGGEWHDSAIELYDKVKDTHSDMPILTGTLLLYLAGRFEFFVKTIFEDLCDAIVDQCEEFAHLPKKMQQNLITYTAEVIGSPRKYGHAKNGVIAFVSVLADNLKGRSLTAVNSKCLSITNENMWADTLAELFGRISAKKIWERIGQQASIQRFFEIDDAAKATKAARDLLDSMMTTRNKIAHPSGDIEWPSKEQVRHYLTFCETLAITISGLCEVLATTIARNENESNRE